MRLATWDGSCHPQPRSFPALLYLPWLLLLIFLFKLTLDLTRVDVLPPPKTPAGPVWGEKPVLGYFTLTESLAGLMQRETGISEDQLLKMQQIAYLERAQLHALEQESLAFVKDPSLTLSEKRARIIAMDYNQRVTGIIQASNQNLKTNLGEATYSRFVRWVEYRWSIERRAHGRGMVAPSLNKSNPRTFRIFATRYDSKGAYTVALPDKCLKFANAGNHLCDEDGYQVSQGYSVYLTYKKSVAVVVGESGPWNVDDNYWSKGNDPQPRRLFADLTLGLPEAQAAYFNGYNGGLDQFGRKVTAPFGIDLARDVSIDIGLQPGVNDWIDISFLWTAGWGSGGSAPLPTPKPGEQTTLQPTVEIIQPVLTSTPNPDGSIVHEVQAGQALWSIAIAYQTKIKDILSLNNLADSVIFPGQKLVIPPVGTSITVGATGTLTSTAVTRTPPGSPQPGYTPGATTLITTPPATFSSPRDQPKPTPSDKPTIEPPLPNTDPLLVIIVILGLVGMGLILGGTLMKRGGQ